MASCEKVIVSSREQFCMASRQVKIFVVLAGYDLSFIFLA
jgi:hypothetical protein